MSKLAVDQGVQVDTTTDGTLATEFNILLITFIITVIHAYKAMLVASTEEEIDNVIESVKKMGYARDITIGELEIEGKLILRQGKYYLIVLFRMKLFICMLQIYSQNTHQQEKQH